jgi:hypothetical protein
MNRRRESSKRSLPFWDELLGMIATDDAETVAFSLSRGVRGEEKLPAIAFQGQMTSKEVV